ncbi:hypothetical protein BSL78_21154 [Apostichopus japonicus]|uniref:J domain-containing protein n=1 Tax=Stichopus japonicus TaxID=307972 RepID=A0A2G8K1V6_STIJA|nr:hypothetical protein BSL78_21154 [Apostichopus japonicus]
MSESKRLREEGNKLFLKALTEGLSPFLAKDRLSKALKYYYQANVNAQTTNEASSALKNIGETHYQMAKIIWKECTNLTLRSSLKRKEKMEDEIRFHAKESLKELFSSLQRGCGQSEAWRDKMDSDISAVFSDVVSFVSFGDFDRRVAAMFVLAKCMAWKELRALLLVQIAQVLYQHSVNCLEEEDFRGSLRAVHEMHYPLEEAERLTSYEEMKTDIRVLKADSMYQLASAESMQTSAIACEQLARLLEQIEFLNMNMVFDTLDMFKDAALKAREINLEQEAMACYYQGHIFEKVLKLKQKGKTFYMKVMELTEAAKPKLFNHEKWYRDCTASLKIMQEEARQRDDRAQEEARAKFRKEMEKELNALTAAKNSGSVVELLKHVYSKHPPKNDPPKLDIKEVEDWDEKEQSVKKRLLIKAMSDYHPDKNSKDEYGEKWHFLTEEISKNITYFHEILK